MYVCVNVLISYSITFRFYQVQWECLNNFVKRRYGRYITISCTSIEKYLLIIIGEITKDI